MTDRVDEATSPATAEDLRAAVQHARWVHHCLTETSDFDWLPGDTKSAMVSMANTIVALAAIRDSERATREADARRITELEDRVTEAVSRLPISAYVTLSWVRADALLSRLPTSPEPEEPGDPSLPSGKST